MSVLDGFHLPGLQPDDVEQWITLNRGGATVRSPLLRSGTITRLASDLRRARAEVLETRSAREIAAIIDRATVHLLESGTFRPVLDALPALTGYSPPMVQLVLERMAQDWRRPALEGLLDAELEGGRALDTFIERAGRPLRSIAVAAPLSVHIFSGNVPGVSVTSVVRALLVRSAVLGKTASGEPLLAPAFARSLADVDPALGRCLAVLYWPGGEEERTAEALAAADAVVVYGGRDAVLGVRRQAPAHARIIEHGPRFSIGLVAREALPPGLAGADVAETVARATAVFDQQGCVSPHAIWVEGDHGAARGFAQALAGALERLAESLPRGAIDAGSATAIRAVSTAAEFRAIAGEPVEIWGDPGRGWVVILDVEGDFTPSPLFRTITVHAVDGLERVAPRLVPWGGFLHTVAIAAPPGRAAGLASAMAETGATRITDFDRMPWPAVAGHHDGRGPLTELVRWVDLE